MQHGDIVFYFIIKNTLLRPSRRPRAYDAFRRSRTRGRERFATPLRVANEVLTIIFATFFYVSLENRRKTFPITNSISRGTQRCCRKICFATEYSSLRAHTIPVGIQNTVCVTLVRIVTIHVRRLFGSKMTRNRSMDGVHKCTSRPMFVRFRSRSLLSNTSVFRLRNSFPARGLHPEKSKQTGHFFGNESNGIIERD